MLRPDAATRERIDAFMSRVEDASFFTFSQDTSVKDTKTGETRQAKYAVAHDDVQFGISYETYNKYPEFIDAKLAGALEKRKLAERTYSFPVQALLGNYGSLLGRKLIPYDLFRVLKAEGEVYYQSREYLDDMDDFEGDEGWQITKAGEARIQEHADKIATEEQKQLVQKLHQKQREEAAMEEQRRQNRREAIKISDELSDLALQSPWHQLKGKAPQYTPRGEKIEDPQSPPNIYGGGRWYVIEEDRILAITNNGSDGDDWSGNTIRTGGAGAIARILPKSDELVQKLRRMQELASA